MADAVHRSSFDVLIEKDGAAAALAMLRARGPAAKPDARDIRHLLSVAAATRDMDSAEAALTMLTRSSHDVDWLELAREMLEKKSPLLVLKALEKLPEDQAERFGVLEMRARAEAQLNVNLARETAGRLTKLFPTTSKAWLLQSRICNMQGDLTEERQSLYEALKFDLKNYAIIRRLAEVSAALKKNSESLSLWQQCLRLQPNDVIAKIGVMRQLVRLKRYDEAQDLLRKADEESIDDPEITRIRNSIPASTAFLPDNDQRL